MSRRKLSGQAVVVQLDQSCLRMAWMALGAAEPEVRQSRVLQLPEGTVEDGSILNVDMLEQIMVSALDDPSVPRTRRVVFTLCTTQVISESVTVPKVSGRRLEKLLETNADMYFPVAMQGYHLVWEVTGDAKAEEGIEQQTVQLWGVPQSLLVPYYDLADRCGLSVAAIDYFGSSMAAGVGASFAASGAEKPRGKIDWNKPIGRKARKEEHPEEMPEVGQAAESAETQAYLMVEPEHMLVTFVHGGQVKLQRVLRRGGNAEEDLRDVQMVMEYYNSVDTQRYSDIRGFVCGSDIASLAHGEEEQTAGGAAVATAAAQATTAEAVAQISDALGISVELWGDSLSTAWCICKGASHASLEFGIPALNRSKGLHIDLGDVWKTVILVGGGGALVAILLLTITSRIAWTTSNNKLQQTRDALLGEASKVAGYADNYYTYKNMYDSYSNDWDNLFSNLRTYNNNLVLMLGELESIMPKGVSATDINIAAEGLSVQFACNTKQDAARLIIELRELKYAELNSISNLSGGGTSSAGSSTTGSTTGSTSGTTSGSTSGTNSALESLLGQLGSGSGTGLSQSGLNTKTIAAALMGLSQEELDILEQRYRTIPGTNSMSSLLPYAAEQDRREALTTMLKNDPVAQYRFLILFKADIGSGNSLMKPVITSADLTKFPTGGVSENTKEWVDALVETLVKNETSISATESLIAKDQMLAERYGYYLAVAMNRQKAVSNPAGMDMNQILSDYANRANLSTSLRNALEKLMQQYSGGSSGSGGDREISQIIQDYTSATGSGSGSQQSDGKYRLSVSLGYKQELIDEELERQGMPSTDKLKELEVPVQ